MKEKKPIEEKGKDFADTLLKVLLDNNIYSQQQDPNDAFNSGVYFGAVQGYKRGTNEMLHTSLQLFPKILSRIIESKFDLRINWPEEWAKMILEDEYGIQIKDDKQ